MTTPHLRASSAALIIPVLGLGLALTACSGGDDSSEGKAAEPDSPSVFESSTVPSGDNGDIKEPEGAIGDLSQFTCEKKGKSWSAAGRLANESDATTTYLVQVTVHSKAKGTVFGSAKKTFKLEAGKKKKFELPDFYSGKESKVECTPRVVKGA